ncbi:SAF domain-containing protein [Micromonospora sp. DSM 115977]|uniref:SAF domain-containing protein n=1 Tax=Micromonospora reichwaldensis TaxID=3075516 RepID=A0ABU2X1V2_9ACTN|nr:SAF domain-containing protein [Micromonospora sp. DSM 115977]MDT0532165.1 SAF domain-containing protein [Micromonospora sp. DSM 115977]
MTSTPTKSTRAASPVAAPYAIPRVAPQRRWRPALVWLAVALVAAGGLIAAAVLRTVGTTAEYLAVSTTVEVGSVLDRSDLSTVRITVDPALKPIRASAADQVVGRFAAVALVPGTLLTQAQLTDTAVPGQGQQLVGLSLPQERLPAERVIPGAEVLLVVTTDDGPVSNQQQTAAPMSIKATVVDVRTGAKEGTTLLNVAVAERDGPLVASRAAAGRIVVALTTGN